MKRLDIVVLALCMLVGSSAAGPSLDSDRLTVLITGSNRGIGLEFARQFAEAGWNVIATTRHPASADDLRRLASDHESIVIEPLDVTDARAIRALADKYAGQAIDVLLSNAALTPKNDATRSSDWPTWICNWSGRAIASTPWDR